VQPCVDSTPTPGSVFRRLLDGVPDATAQWPGPITASLRSAALRIKADGCPALLRLGTLGYPDLCFGYPTAVHPLAYFCPVACGTCCPRSNSCSRKLALPLRPHITRVLLAGCLAGGNSEHCPATCTASTRVPGSCVDGSMQFNGLLRARGIGEDCTDIASRAATGFGRFGLPTSVAGACSTPLSIINKVTGPLYSPPAGYGRHATVGDVCALSCGTCVQPNSSSVLSNPSNSSEGG
jgi:hypothetical protein